MSMIRMFHIACDAPKHSGYDIGDEWYAAVARQRAREEGYHLKGDQAICADCWGDGVRFPDLPEY